GQSLADYTRKKIFEPAGMTHTEWRANYKKIVPNRAIAYAKNPEGYFTNMPNEYVYGNGGLLTTAEDLLTWTNYCFSGKLGSPSLLQKQLATNPLNNGNANSYAAGLFVTKYNGIDLVTHDGATASYRANLDHFPSLGLTIAWLSNTSEFDAGTYLPNTVREIFIKPAVVNAGAQPPATIKLSKEQLNSYAGWYRNERSGSGLKVAVRDSLLTVSQIGPIRPIAERVFAVGNSPSRVEFLPDRKGFIFVNQVKDTTYFTAKDSANASSGWQEYLGEYYSDEAQVFYLIKLKEGKPVLLLKPNTEYTLTPTYKDAFELPPGFMYFERDKKNKINGFKLSVGRARNVAFIKK
ncbi:MAG TPA: serine hydrolase, partial [Chitinophagaceae bacterium]|nr:serine hydrolase [Chitinophagaceae bacterium]